MNTDIKRLEGKFDKFVEIYENDMRGDTRINGGRLGLVDHMRDVRRYIHENPSLIWLIRNKPTPTIVVFLIIFLLMDVFMRIGFFVYLLPALGIEIPLY